MNARTTVCFMLLVLLMAMTARGTEYGFLQGLGNSEYHKLDSQLLGREFHVYVMLPEGYEPDSARVYPTVYLLDGGALFPLLASYYRYLNFDGEVPDSIIVGISYGSDSFEGGNYRSTDYTAPSVEREYWGGAGKFQAFLKDELIPRIERDYRARPDRRVVFGQSIGGQFVLYTALTEPALFWGHVASNPALHRNLPFFLESDATVERGASQSRLFVASASNDDPRFREPALEWMSHWSSKARPLWLLKTVTLDGHSHMSAPPAAFREGMRWLFTEGPESVDETP